MASVVAVVRNCKKSEQTTIGVVGRVRRRISDICQSGLSWIYYFFFHDPDVATVDVARRFESGDEKTDNEIGRPHNDSKIRMEIDIAIGKGRSSSSSTSSGQGERARNSAPLARSKIEDQVGKTCRCVSRQHSVQNSVEIVQQTPPQPIDDDAAWTEADRPPSAARTRSRQRLTKTRRRRRRSPNGHVQKRSAETLASCPQDKTQPSTKSLEASPPSTNDQVSVEVEDAVFSLNRNPLEEQSKFFKKLSATYKGFDNRPEIVIKGIGVDGFCHALRWIYSREVRLTESNVQRVLDAAIGLEIEELAHQCLIFTKDLEVKKLNDAQVTVVTEQVKEGSRRR